MRDSQAAKSLLVRRLRCLSNYEAANRALEKARHKNKDIHAVSIKQKVCKFDNVTIILNAFIKKGT